MKINKWKYFSAWFGGDPHMISSTNRSESCNVFGSFIYARTTQAANQTAVSSGSSGPSGSNIYRNDLFAIVASTSTTQSLLRNSPFYNATLTYFSSFKMLLGAQQELTIDVGINPNDSYQFRMFLFIEFDWINSAYTSYLNWGIFQKSNTHFRRTDQQSIHFQSHEIMSNTFIIQPVQTHHLFTRFRLSRKIKLFLLMNGIHMQEEMSLESWQYRYHD